MKHNYPAYTLKSEFTPGTFSENEWKPGESACVDRSFFILPNGSEYAVFKFATRTQTGRKSLRWEVYHNGRFSNNYFNGYDEAVQCIKDEISFWGFDGSLHSYRVHNH